ncbi:hypothetical protein ACXZ1K_19165 [Pedobacter sp. PWIIR3]
MKRIILLFLLILDSLFGRQYAVNSPLKISDDGHSFQHSDGKP